MTAEDRYQNAPATDLLATHCCLCGRALVDAASVERGIGPTCAEKAGAGEAAHPADWDRVRAVLARVGLAPTTDDARREANRLVHRVGAGTSAPEVPHLIEALEALGYLRLAGRIAERLVSVTVVVTCFENRLTVTTSKLEPELFERYVAALRSVPGRRWDKDARANVLPVSSKRALWNALTTCLPRGAVIVGARVCAVA